MFNVPLKPGIVRRTTLGRVSPRIRQLRAQLQSKRRSPLWVATELTAIKEQSGLSWPQLESRLDLSRTHRRLLLSLLTLPADMAQTIAFGQSTRKPQGSPGLGLKHARSLYLLREQPDEQRALFEQLQHERHSANAALRRVLAKRQGQRMDTRPHAADPNVRAALDRLRYRFGTKVELQSRSKGGAFVFEFYSEEDMIRLFDLFL